MKKNKPENLEINLIDSLTNEALDIIPDFAEVGLDAMLNDNILKEIPIIGSLVKLHKIGRNIRDMLFLKKVLLFFQELSKIPKIEREEFAKSLEKDPTLKRKTGEALLLTLERLDDMDKPNIVAKIFAYYMKGKIDHPTMLRFISIVDRATVPDLKKISWGGSAEANSRLAGLGLRKIASIGIHGDGYNDNGKEYDFRKTPDLLGYSESKDGKLLREILSEK